MGHSKAEIARLGSAEFTASEDLERATSPAKRDPRKDGKVLFYITLEDVISSPEYSGRNLYSIFFAKV